MTDPELRVDPVALHAFAATSRSRADRFRDLALTFNEAEVSRGAFGIMPASYSLSAKYTEFFDSCLQGLRDAADVMDDISEGADDTATAYTGTDVANRDLFQPQPQGETYWAPGPSGTSGGSGNGGHTV